MSVADTKKQYINTVAAGTAFTDSPAQVRTCAANASGPYLPWGLAWKRCIEYRGIIPGDGNRHLGFGVWGATELKPRLRG